MNESALRACVCLRGRPRTGEDGFVAPAQPPISHTRRMWPGEEVIASTCAGATATSSQAPHRMLGSVHSLADGLACPCRAPNC